MKTYIKDRVSVIIPTHNRAQYIERALKSVLNQSYENIDIIIINDNSADNTKEILEKYQDDDRFTIVNSKKNLGGAQARNIGLDMAQGEFIAFLDDDDEWLIDKTKYQVEFLKKNEECTIVSCDYLLVKKHSIKRKVNKILRVNINDLLYKNYLGSFSFCMVRSIDIAVNRINPNLKTSQDWDLWIKVLNDSNGRAEILKIPLVKYHNDINIKLTNNYLENVNSYWLFIKDHWNLMNKSHKYYHLHLINDKKNYIIVNENNIRNSLNRSCKSIIFLAKSKYSYNPIGFIKILMKTFIKINGFRSIKKKLYLD